MVAIALAVTGLVIAVVAISLTERSPGEVRIEISGRAEASTLYSRLDQDGPALGPQDAPVTISVFNDLQCSSCAAYHLTTVTPLVDRYVRAGRVRLVMRHFPMGRRPRTIAAFAAVAAGEQDNQWEFIDLVFRNHDQAPDGIVSNEFLKAVASTVPGLNVERWQRDRDDPALEAWLASDADVALELRLPAQPAVVVEGPSGQRKLERSPTTKQIEQAINAVTPQ